jgi:hypothetical protein
MDMLFEGGEIFLTALTLGSIILTVVPLYPLGGISTKAYALCVWLDFYMTTVFLVDFITRFITRDLKEVWVKRGDNSCICQLVFAEVDNPEREMSD